jgi:hypothetical protein
MAMKILRLKVAIKKNRGTDLRDYNDIEEATI